MTAATGVGERQAGGATASGRGVRDACREVRGMAALGRKVRGVTATSCRGRS